MNNMGEPRIKIVAMPKDTNPAGNIFGGWIMSQIDLAGALATRDLPIYQVVTVAVNSMSFRQPIFVGDVVSFYAKVVELGSSSVKVDVEVTSERTNNETRSCVHVTSAIVTYVSVDKEGKKKPIECSNNYKRTLGLKINE